MCTKNNLSFSPGSVFTLYIQIMCVYIIYNVCVLLMKRHSFPSTWSQHQKPRQVAFLCEGITKQLSKVTIVWPLLQRLETHGESHGETLGFPMGRTIQGWKIESESPGLWAASNCSFRQYVKYLNSAQLRTKRDQAYSVTGKVTGNCGLKSRRTPKRTRAVSLGQVGEVAESDPSFRPLHVWKLVPTCHVHIDLYVIIHMSGCTRYDVSL